MRPIDAPSVVAYWLFCTIGANMAAVTTVRLFWLEAQSSPHDGARGVPFLLFLVDPVVLMVVVPVVWASGLLAFVLVYFWLHDTVTWLSLAFLYVLVPAAIIVVGRSDPILAFAVAHPALLTGVAFCKVAFKRRNFQWAS
jgi:hypothetical protein